MGSGGGEFEFGGVAPFEAAVFRAFECYTSHPESFGPEYNLFRSLDAAA